MEKNWGDTPNATLINMYALNLPQFTNLIQGKLIFSRSFTGQKLTFALNSNE